MTSSSLGDHASPREAGRSALDYAKSAFIGGLAVVVPFLVTVIVLATIVQYAVNYLYAFLGAAPNTEAGPVMTVIVVVALLLFVLVVGFVTQFQYGEMFVDYVDAVLSGIPGFGAIYDSFREMSDVMMESDQQSFRDVKLVEFPHEGAYTLGFLTAESAGALKDAAGREDLVTLFLPLAPNPVMGGHLVHVPAGRVMDVDMTVDEGLRTVVTSGVATGGPRDELADDAGLSEAQLERLGVDPDGAVSPTPAPADDDDRRRERGVATATRHDAYEERAAPDSADEEPVPSEVETYGDDETLGESAETPRAVETEESDTLGESAETPGAVESEDADTIGEGAETPHGVETEESDTLGEGAETPADVESDRDVADSLGLDADRPGDIDEDDAGGRWRDQTRVDDAATEGVTDEERDDANE